MATDTMFPIGQDMTNVSPQDVKDAKDRAKQTKAFDKADKTPPAPALPASAVKKMKKGGRVIDGIAQRGKTRGRMI